MGFLVLLVILENLAIPINLQKKSMDSFAVIETFPPTEYHDSFFFFF